MKNLKTYEGFFSGIKNKAKEIITSLGPSPELIEADKIAQVLYDIVIDCDPSEIEFQKEQYSWIVYSIAISKGLPVDKLEAKSAGAVYKIIVSGDELECSNIMKEKIFKKLEEMKRKEDKIMAVRRIKSKVGL